MVETNSPFWREIDEILHARSEFLPKLISEEERFADQSAYESNLPFLREFVDEWARELQVRSFVIVEKTAETGGLKLAYFRHGFKGYGGLASWRNIEGRIVAGIVGPAALNTLYWPADPETCIPLGTGFDREKFSCYAQDSLRTFLDEGNVLMTPNSWANLRKRRFAEFEEELGELRATLDRQQIAGKKFEVLLERLFTMERLAPRGSFRLQGEEIDGSFVLDNEVYLVEAKLRSKDIEGKDLAHFSEKIERKSRFTRGVLVTTGGVSEGGMEWFRRGKPQLFFILTGGELSELFKFGGSLPDLLRRRQRLLCEEGRALANR